MNHIPLVEDFFRHEYGRLVATLARRVGVRHIESIEDAAQSALLKALETWPRAGTPSNPSAWLYRVAHNRVLDHLRATSRRGELIEQHAEVEAAEQREDEFHLKGEIEEDLLRMLFVCCDESIPRESQIVLALKTLCGFSVREIALRLFASEANVYKRLERARAKLREHASKLVEFSREGYASRIPRVRQILYVLFTEGYLSSHQDEAIRRELCSEAIRLTSILAEHPIGGDPETYALLALMFLHDARLDARNTAGMGLLLLEEQDRTLWNHDEIRLGIAWLARAAEGDDFSRYHAEAGIAAEHCMSPSFHDTRWEKIEALYRLWEQSEPSPMHRVNRALVTAEWKGPNEGLAVLVGAELPAWLGGSYLVHAALSDLHRRCGHAEKAEVHRERALEGAPSEAIQKALKRRLNL